MNIKPLSKNQDFNLRTAIMFVIGYFLSYEVANLSKFITYFDDELKIVSINLAFILAYAVWFFIAYKLNLKLLFLFSLLILIWFFVC